MKVATSDIEEWGSFVRASISSDTMMSRRRSATIALSALIGKIYRLLEEVHYLEEDAKMARESFTSLVIERDRLSEQIREREGAVEWLRAEAFRYNEVNGEAELALLRAADILERAVPSDAYQRGNRDGLLSFAAWANVQADQSFEEVERCARVLRNPVNGVQENAARAIERGSMHRMLAYRAAADHAHRMSEALPIDPEDDHEP